MSEKLNDLNNKLANIESELETAQKQVNIAENEADNSIINALPNEVEKVASEGAVLVTSAKNKTDTLSRAIIAIQQAISKEKKDIEWRLKKEHMEKRKAAAYKLDDNLKKIELKLQEAGHLITDIVADTDLIAHPVSTTQHRRVLVYLCVANILEPAMCILNETPTFKGQPKPLEYPLAEVLSKITV